MIRRRESSFWDVDVCRSVWPRGRCREDVPAVIPALGVGSVVVKMVCEAAGAGPTGEG